MRMFRSSLLLGLALLFVELASGQNLRVEAGLNASNIRLSMPQISYSGDVRYGYRIGLGAEIKLNNRWHLAPMLMIKSSGAKLKLQANLSGDVTTEEIRLSDLPTSIQWQSMLGKQPPELVEHEVFLPIFVGMQMRPFARWFTIKLEVAPYLGYTFSSRLNIKNYALNLADLKTISMGMAERHPWEGGVSGSIALSVYGVYLKAGLEYGLLNRFQFSLSEQQRRLIEQELTSMPRLSMMTKSISSNGVSTTALSYYVVLGIHL